MCIKIKSMNDSLIFIFDENEKFEVLLDTLKGLLDKPIFSNEGFFPKAFFDFKCRILEESEVDQLLDILFEKQVVTFAGVSGIIPSKESSIHVINRTIHGGEEIHLDQETLIIGHINAGAIVTFIDKLYVVGTIHGMVEGLGAKSKISAQSFQNAHIRINGVSRHSYTSLELTMLYYRDNDICLDKGEMIYV